MQTQCQQNSYCSRLYCVGLIGTDGKISSFAACCIKENTEKVSFSKYTRRPYWPHFGTRWLAWPQSTWHQRPFSATKYQVVPSPDIIAWRQRVPVIVMADGNSGRWRWR